MTGPRAGAGPAALGPGAGERGQKASGRCVAAQKNGQAALPPPCSSSSSSSRPVAPAPRVPPVLPGSAALCRASPRASLADAISRLPPPLASSLMKTLSVAAATSGLRSSSPPFTAPSRGGRFPRRPAPALCGAVTASIPGRRGEAARRHLPPAPTAGRACSPLGTGTSPPPAPRPRSPAAARGSGAGACSGLGALLCMDGAAFGVMKYSQVSGSLRNDGDQSIPFQGVIFFPFTAPVSC